MAWMMDTYSNHVGHISPGRRHGQADRARRLAGPARGHRGGVAYLVGKYLDDMKIQIEQATVAIQGFGNVGSETAAGPRRHGRQDHRHLGLHGRASTTPAGSTSRRPSPTSSTRASCKDFDGGEAITNEQLLELECTVLIPAALERVITEENAPKLKCRLLAEAANGPTTNEADRIIERRERHRDHPGRPVQLRRRHRLLLRVAAEPPELLLEPRRGDGEAPRHPRQGEGVGRVPEAQVQVRPPARGADPWDRAASPRPSRAAASSRRARPRRARVRRRPPPPADTGFPFFRIWPISQWARTREAPSVVMLKEFKEFAIKGSVVISPWA